MTLRSASYATGVLALHWDGSGARAGVFDGFTAGTGTGIARALTLSESMTVSRFISFDTHCSIFVIVFAAIRIHDSTQALLWSPPETLAHTSGRGLTQSS